MNRYYFDVICNGKEYNDEYGVCFEDFEEARRHGQIVFPVIIQSRIPDISDPEPVRRIKDEFGTSIYLGS